MTYINPLWFVLLAVFLFQLVLSVYVFINAKRYQMNPLFWAFLVLFIPNFMGVIIYYIVRNQEKEKHQCKSCGRTIEKNYLHCPYCGVDHSLHCNECFYPIHGDWTYCPNCASELKGE